MNRKIALRTRARALFGDTICPDQRAYKQDEFVELWIYNLKTALNLSSTIGIVRGTFIEREVLKYDQYMFIIHGLFNDK